MRTKLLSITANDFDWSYTRGTGKGGQKKNKTSSAVHCKHPPSGAKSYSEKTRSQSKNKQDAFLKCVNSNEFQTWLKIANAKAMGQDIDIESKVDNEMKNIKIEYKENGKWTKQN